MQNSAEWPAGRVLPQFAATEADYPADIWSEALTRWDGLGEAGQEDYRAQTAEYVGAMLEQNSSGLLLSSFGPWDLLWFGLAGWTAFKLGASGTEE